MRNEDRPPRLDGPRVAAVGTLGRALAVAGAAVLVAGFFPVSLLLLAVLLVLGLAAWGYIWWGTRDLRRQMREQFVAMQARARDEAAEATIIEGEFTRTPERDAGR
jgi:uncharacterized protein HemX